MKMCQLCLKPAWQGVICLSSALCPEHQIQQFTKGPRRKTLSESVLDGMQDLIFIACLYPNVSCMLLRYFEVILRMDLLRVMSCRGWP